jgi:hypothetical protein
MKKQNITSIALISLAYLSPVFVTLYFREKLFHSMNPKMFDFFSGMMIVFYGVHIFKYFMRLFKPQIVEKQSSNNRLNIIWAFFCLSVSILMFYYSNNHDLNAGYNPLVILFGIFMMIDGNYQSVILPKNVALENGIGEGYEENVYRKSQRLKGRFQFYLGLIIVITFLILPNTPRMWLYGFGGIMFIYYIGGWIFMYKNTQIIADSEAKTK